MFVHLYRQINFRNIFIPFEPWANISINTYNFNFHISCTFPMFFLLARNNEFLRKINQDIHIIYQDYEKRSRRREQKTIKPNQTDSKSKAKYWHHKRYYYYYVYVNHNSNNTRINNNNKNRIEENLYFLCFSPFLCSIFHNETRMSVRHNSRRIYVYASNATYFRHPSLTQTMFTWFNFYIVRHSHTGNKRLWKRNVGNIEGKGRKNYVLNVNWGKINGMWCYNRLIACHMFSPKFPRMFYQTLA